MTRSRSTLARGLVGVVALGGTAAGMLLTTVSPAFAAVDAKAKARTVTGPSVSTPYGPVQVRVQVRGARLVDVGAVQTPSGDPRSRAISAFAVPQLRRQALAAQSARIDGVSGASYTSAGLMRSLQAALAQGG